MWSITRILKSSKLSHATTKKSSEIFNAKTVGKISNLSMTSMSNSLRRLMIIREFASMKMADKIKKPQAFQKKKRHSPIPKKSVKSATKEKKSAKSEDILFSDLDSQKLPAGRRKFFRNFLSKLRKFQPKAEVGPFSTVELPPKITTASINSGITGFSTDIDTITISSQWPRIVQEIQKQFKENPEIPENLAPRTDINSICAGLEVLLYDSQIFFPSEKLYNSKIQEKLSEISGELIQELYLHYSNKIFDLSATQNVFQAEKVLDEMIERGIPLHPMHFHVIIVKYSEIAQLGNVVGCINKMQSNGLLMLSDTCNAVISLLIYEKKVPDALRFKSEMKELGIPRTEYSYGPIIYSTSSDKPEKALEILDEMLSDIETKTLSNTTTKLILEAYAKFRGPDFSSEFLEFFSRKKISPNSEVIFHGAKILAALGKTSDVIEVMKNINEKKNSNYFHEIIKVMCDFNRSPSAMEFLDFMNKQQIIPDTESFFIIHKSFINNNWKEPAEKLIAFYLSIFEEKPSRKFYENLIGMYLNVGNFGKVFERFTEMFERGYFASQILWNKILGKLVAYNHATDAFNFFRQMKAQNVPTNSKHANKLISILFKAHKHNRVVTVFLDMRNSKIPIENSSVGTVIKSLCIQKKSKDAYEIYKTFNKQVTSEDKTILVHFMKKEGHEKLASELSGEKATDKPVSGKDEIPSELEPEENDEEIEQESKLIDYKTKKGKLLLAEEWKQFQKEFQKEEEARKYRL